MFVWTVSDVIGLGLFAITVVVALCVSIYTLIKQRFCKHDGTFGETSQCHAICHKCGKDLGNISDWRKKQWGK